MVNQRFLIFSDSLHYFTLFLIDCTWVKLLLPYKDWFSTTVPPLPLNFPSPVGIIFQVKILSDVGFIFSLLKYFYRYPHIFILDFWILNIWRDLGLSFYVSSEGKEGKIICYVWLFFKSEPENINFSKSLCSTIFWSSTLKYWRSTYLLILMNSKSVIWSEAFFSNTETWICFQSFFQDF